MASTQPPDLSLCACGVLRVDCLCNTPAPTIRALTAADLVPLFKELPTPPRATQETEK